VVSFQAEKTIMAFNEELAASFADIGLTYKVYLM
jgi:hypothetical protein